MTIFKWVNDNFTGNFSVGTSGDYTVQKHYIEIFSVWTMGDYTVQKHYIEIFFCVFYTFFLFFTIFFCFFFDFTVMNSSVLLIVAFSHGVVHDTSGHCRKC